MQRNGRPIYIADSKEPPQLSSWIHHPHSLTDKLQKALGQVDLKVLAQGWIRPTWWDRYLLSVPDAFLFQREILMNGNGLSYWYARSIIPKHCFDIAPQFFQRLERESIKNLIFNVDEVRRESIVCYPIDSQCIEFYWVKPYLKEVTEALWIRLSSYSFQEKASFFLVEILFKPLEKVNA